MNNNIHVVLDSISAVNETDFFNDPRVHMARLVLRLGNDEWYDGEKSLEELVEMMESTGKIPTTSQPPLGDLIELFTDLSNQGKKVLMVTMSAGMSGTYHTACMAADQVMHEIKGADIRIINGKTCGCSLVGMAKAILEKADAGCDDMDELERLGNDCVKRTKTYFTVDTLEYLRKGGRIGKAAALLGSIFGIRPILIMDKDGKVESIDKLRTRKKVLQKLIDLAGCEPDVEGFYVCGALCQADMEMVVAKLKEVYPGVPYYQTSIGAVLTAHLGPGVIAVMVRVRE